MQQSFFRKGDLLLAMLLFSLHSLPNVHKYIKHSVSKHIDASKNTFYRLKNNTQVNWRGLVKKCNRKLLKYTENSSGDLVKWPLTTNVLDVCLEKWG